LRDIEQGLEQMKRVPSQDADMQIVPGDLPGESDVVIDLKHGKPWRFSASLDDTGAEGTGKLQAGFDLAIDNLFGINDMFSIAFNNDADNNSGNRGTRGSSANYSMPWGNFTFTLSGGSSFYHQFIAGANQTFISSGKSDNLEFKTAYLFHRDQSSKSSIQFRTGKRWSRAFIDDTEITVQRRNATLAELALVHKHYIGQAQLDVTAAHRWGAPWFGAQEDAANLPATSPSFRYNLQTVDATLTAPFKVAGKAMNYTGTFRAQYAKSPLYASEWFTIGNRWTVRGFDGENSLGAEKGFFLRNELSIPIADTSQASYAGLDFGKLYGPSVANLIGDKLAGAALGLRGNIFGGVSYDIFASWALYKPQGMQTVQPAAGFSVNYQM
jgi:hemolysin activation/secretion protein